MKKYLSTSAVLLISLGGASFTCSAMEQTIQENEMATSLQTQTNIPPLEQNLSPFLLEILQEKGITKMKLRTRQICKLLSQAPEEQRESLLQYSFSLLETGNERFETNDVSKLIDCLRILCKAPEGELENLVKTALPLLETIKGAQYKVYFFDYLSNIPEGERKNLIKITHPLLEKLIDNCYKFSWFNKVFNIAERKRDNFVKMSLELLTIVDPYKNNDINIHDHVLNILFYSVAEE